MLITTDAEYRALLQEAVALMMHSAPPLGTLESDRLIELSIVIEAWENKHFPTALAL